MRTNPNQSQKWNSPYSTVVKHLPCLPKVKAGNTKGGSITVLLTSCLIGLD